MMSSNIDGSEESGTSDKRKGETSGCNDLSSECSQTVDRKPRSVSQKAWDRFQSLQKKADTLAKRSEEKRIKHLRKQVIETVKESLITEEDKNILQHEIEQYTTGEKQSTTQKPTLHGAGIKQPDNVSAGSNDITEKYQETIQPYMGINDHLKADVVTKKGPQSGLEKEIDSALTTGDVKKAEQLSDKLANRDFAVKITEAADAREYLKRKKDEEDLQKSKKKKKLHWGFEHKQRWETKSNM